jgi:hypothetical protein
MFTIVTGRFNNETKQANYAYREKHGYKCMYCIPTELSPKIYYGSDVFVIEMNNQTNQIVAIGHIKNIRAHDKYYRVHKNGNTNRYIYIGDTCISREVIHRENPQLVEVLEEVLFKGYTHSKRGSGLSLFPEKVLKFDICEKINIKKCIKELFIAEKITN